MYTPHMLIGRKPFSKGTQVNWAPDSHTLKDEGLHNLSIPVYDPRKVQDSVMVG